MPLARCIRRCWDSQLTKRYYPGNVADYPKDHVFIAGNIKCFEIIGPDELSRSPVETDAKLKSMETKIANLTSKIDGKPSDLVDDPPKENKEKRVFSCPICNKEFSNGFDVGKHKKADHPQS